MEARQDKTDGLRLRVERRAHHGGSLHACARQDKTVVSTTLSICSNLDYLSNGAIANNITTGLDKFVNEFIDKVNSSFA
jgi:hypothetical protein